MLEDPDLAPGVARVERDGELGAAAAPLRVPLGSGRCLGAPCSRSHETGPVGFWVALRTTDAHGSTRGACWWIFSVSFRSPCR